MMNEEMMDNRRIMVIDDNHSIHDDFRKVLCSNAGEGSLAQARAALFGDAPRFQEPERFDLDCADQGQAGVSLARKARNDGRPYAVAFVDMRMPPGWDGLETVERL
ncbi:MAG: hypothetical protein OEV17_09890, partial [Nitrospira sp.]|nr:hypothetical protein [Nitrospira sp.]